MTKWMNVISNFVAAFIDNFQIHTMKIPNCICGKLGKLLAKLFLVL